LGTADPVGAGSGARDGVDLAAAGGRQAS